MKEVLKEFSEFIILAIGVMFLITCLFSRMNPKWKSADWFDRIMVFVLGRMCLWIFGIAIIIFPFFFNFNVIYSLVWSIVATMSIGTLSFSSIMKGIKSREDYYLPIVEKIKESIVFKEKKELLPVSTATTEDITNYKTEQWK